MAQVRDKNRIPKVLKEIARINQREARVGVFDDAPNLVRIAALNEFGVDQQLDETLHKRLRALAREYNAPTNTLPKPGERFRVPERSFLRGTADQSHGLIQEAAAEGITGLMEGELDAYETLMKPAEALQDAVVGRIRRGGEFEPLDPFTVALTGEARPLVGKMGVFERKGMGIRARVVKKV